MTQRITLQPWRRVTPFLVAMAVALISACGPSEEELRLEELTSEMSAANAVIDSLNYTVESSNLLIDEMRSRVDSLQQVDQKLLESVQRLNREVRQWRDLASDRKKMNEQLTAEVERMKREKQTDQRSIDRLRASADSINTALLAAHTSIRRQEDHLKRMDMELSQSRDEVALLRQAETSVRVYAATEDYLKDNGYLDSGRSLGRAFRKSFKLIKRIDPSDPRMQLAPIGEALLIEGQIDALVDRFGEVKKGDSYTTKKGEGSRIEVIFTDELLGGSDVLVVLKK